MSVPSVQAIPTRDGEVPELSLKIEAPLKPPKKCIFPVPESIAAILKSPASAGLRSAFMVADVIARPVLAALTPCVYLFE